MHIISGQFQAASQHQFDRTESQVSIRRELAPATPPESAPPRRMPAPASAEAAETGTDSEWSLFKALVEALTGRQIETASISQSAATSTQVAITSTAAAPADNSRVLRIDALQISEQEITEVAFSGQFHTADRSEERRVGKERRHRC